MKTKLNAWGLKMLAPNIDRMIYLILHRLGAMGRHQKKFLESKIQDGMVCIDVGANIGLYALKMASLVGKEGRVIAYEPNPAMAAAITKSAAINGFNNVTIKQVICGDQLQAKNVCLHINKSNSGDSYVSTSSNLQGIVKPVVSLQDDISESRIDFVKIDVQGYEAKVLEGMVNIFVEYKPIVMIEIYPYGLAQYGADALVIRNYFDKLNYAGFTLDGFTVDWNSMATNIKQKSAYWDLFFLPQ